MRAGNLCAALTAAAIVFGACGDPQKVTTFRVDDQGRLVPGSSKEEVVLDRRELWSSGYAYTWDCKYEAPGTIYGGETKQYQLINNSTNGLCRGFGLGGSVVMGIGFNEWSYPGTFTLMDGAQRPSSFRAKMSDPLGGTIRGEHKMYLNTVAGGGCAALSSFPFSACFTNVAPSAEWAGNFNYDNRPKSLDFVRMCYADGQPYQACS